MTKKIGYIPRDLNSKQKDSGAENKTQKPNEFFAATRNKSTAQTGLRAGLTRATFIIEETLNEKLKALAYWERLTLKEVIKDALTTYLQDKDIKPIPKRR